jgi:hypothetical protein
MSFWNIDIDEWIRGRLYLDENILASMFHTTTWYGSNNSCNRYSDFNEIIESYDADLRDIIPHHSIQEWIRSSRDKLLITMGAKLGRPHQ